MKARQTQAQSRETSAVQPSGCLTLEEFNFKNTYVPCHSSQALHFSSYSSKLHHFKCPFLNVALLPRNALYYFRQWRAEFILSLPATKREIMESATMTGSQIRGKDLIIKSRV